jgi:Flp pilus assembly protein TadD
MHLELLIQQVNSLLEMGETRKGIDKIVDYVEGRDDLRREFYDKAIQIKARYLRAKRQVSMQLIDDEVASVAVEQVHMDIATLLVEIDEKLHPTRKSNKSTRSSGFTIGGGIAVIATVLLVALLALFSSETSELPQNFCLTFEKDVIFRVLIIPQEKDAVIAQHISWYCDTLSKAVNLSIVAQRTAVPNVYPQNAKEIEALIGNCDAHLVIWERNNKLQYQFLNTNILFQIPLFYPKDSSIIGSWIVDSNLPTQGELARNDFIMLKQLIVLGLAWQQRAEIYIQLNGKEQGQSKDVTLIQQMYLAQAFLSRKDTLKSIAALNDLLLVTGSYAPAHLNKSVLMWKQKSYKQALEHINKAIELDTINPLTHYTKGYMLWEIGQLEKASYYLKIADTLSSRAGAQWIDFKNNTIIPLQRDIALQQLEINKSIREVLTLLRQGTGDKNTHQNNLLRQYLALGDQNKAQALAKTIATLEAATIEAIQNYLLSATGIDESTLLFWQTYKELL